MPIFDIFTGKKKKEAAPPAEWTVSSPDIVARFDAACQLANEERWEKALTAYIDIFSIDPEKELGWINETAKNKPDPPRGGVLDSELIGLVEIYKADCLRALGKHELAMEKLEDPFVSDMVQRFDNPGHLNQYLVIHATVAGELGRLQLMDDLYKKAFRIALESKKLAPIFKTWNLMSRDRARFGLDKYTRELEPEDITTRAAWGYVESSGNADATIFAKKDGAAEPLVVKALPVEKMLKYVKNAPKGPLLPFPDGKPPFPFEEVAVTPGAVIAVSWKHVGESKYENIYEPSSARQVLLRSLEFARVYGASHLWMDVYCIRPAGVELNDALGWMGELFATATVYPDWAEDKEQMEARSSGWIFQERMWTQLALRRSTVVEAVAELIEYDFAVSGNRFDINKKNAEDLMDIARSALRVTMQVDIGTRYQPWEILARTLVERGEQHPLSHAANNLSHRTTHQVKEIVSDLARFVQEGRKANANEIVVFEPPAISIRDVHKCVSAISTTSLKYESDGPAAYFGVFNARCGTDFSVDNLPAPRQLIGQLIPTAKLESNSTLAGARTEMHVIDLHEEINWWGATQTAFGYAITTGYSRVGFCTKGNVAIVALLNNKNQSELTAFGESYRHALSIMFTSQADALRLPKPLQPGTLKNMEDFIRQLPVVTIA